MAVIGAQSYEIIQSSDCFSLSNTILLEILEAIGGEQTRAVPALSVLCLLC